MKSKRKNLTESTILRVLLSAYNNKLTNMGKVLFWMLVLSSAVGLHSFNLKIYLVFVFLFCLFIVSWFYIVSFTTFFPPKIEVTHFPPGRSTCFHKVSFPVLLRNLSRKEYYDLSVKESNLPQYIRKGSEKEGAIPIFHSRSQTTVELSLEFKKRGHYVLPGIDLDSTFPFGIGRARRHYPQEKSILVYPQFFPLKNLVIPVGKRYQPGGIALTSNLGESTEFIGNREFRTGDNPRNIHWRSSARLGKFVVKEFQEEYFCRIALVLDTYVPPGSSESKYACLESAISLSAAIADNLSRQEYIIDIFAAGPDVYYLQAGRSLAYLENILDILACLEYCTTPPFEKLAPIMLENLSQITTCIMVFLDWDESREHLVRTTCGLGTAVKAIIVSDSPPSVDPTPYEDLIGTIKRITPEEERKGVENL